MTDSDSELKALNWKIVYDNIELIAFMHSFAVIGLCGYILSVYFFGFKARKNMNDTLLAFLTTSNAIANIISIGELPKYINYFTYYNEIGCKVHFFLTHSITKISGINLLFIALNRHQLLCYPFSWQFTPKILSVSLSSVVVFLIFSSSIQLIIGHIELVEMRPEENGTVLDNSKYINMTTERNGTKFAPNTSRINEDYLKDLDCVNLTSGLNGTASSCMGQLNRTFAHTMTARVCTNRGKLNESDKIIFEIFNISDLLVTILSFLLVVYCYSCIIKVTFYHRKQRRKLQQTDILNQKDKKFRTDIKITLMTLTITVMSILSFTPYYVARSLQNPYDVVSDDQIRLRLISGSYMINNVIDPYALLVFIPNFRRFVRHTFSCGTCHAAGDNRVP